MKIKAIYVDIGGVLIVNGAKEVGEKYENSDGLTQTMTSKVFRYIHTANRTNDEINEFLKNENITPETWNNFTREFYLSEKRNDELVELLYQSKLKGILIVITTNNSSALTKGLQKYKIDDLADLTINSFEKHIAKPDKKFWEIAFEESLQLLPEITQGEILVLDDSKLNCESADRYPLN